MQIFEDSSVLHQVETVVDVKSFLLRQDKGVADQFRVGDSGREVIEGVAGLDRGGVT